MQDSVNDQSYIEVEDPPPAPTEDDPDLEARTIPMNNYGCDTVDPDDTQMGWVQVKEDMWPPPEHFTGTD